jgi:hypothetical protein
VAVEGAASHPPLAKPVALATASSEGAPVFKQTPCALDPQRFDISGWGLPDLAVRRAGERAFAHERALGENGNRQVLVKVAGNRRLQFAELGVGGLLD